MADMPALTPAETAAARAAEEEGFYHESALNATWTGSRLAIGGLAFLVTIISAASAASARETYRLPLSELGKPDGKPVGEAEYEAARLAAAK